MPLLFSEGVLRERIDINTFVALTSTNAAKLYGLYPRKGTIAVGSDADMVIWNTGASVTIANAMLHHDVDYTPYEGIVVNAWPDITLSRGEVVWSNPEMLASPGRGQYLRAARPAPAARRRMADA